MKHFLRTSAVFLMTTTFASADAVETCLFETEDWAATLAACTEAFAASDDPVEQGRFILNRGIAHENLGDIEAARSDQMLVGQYRPDWFLGYANAATMSELLGDEEGHLRMAEAAIAADPDNPRAYLELLYLQVNDGAGYDCLDIADRVISLLPHPIDWPFARNASPHLMGNLGYCLQVNERYDEALRAYQSAEHMGLDEQWLFHYIADISYFDLGVGHEERAIAAGMRALSFDDPDYRDIHVVVGANADLGHLDEAFAVATQYSDVLDASIEELGTRNILGWGLFLAGRHAEASQIMEVWVDWATPRAEAGQPTYGFMWDTVAHVRAAVGDTEGAAKAFRLAVLFDDDQDYVQGFYRDELTALGYAVAEGRQGVLLALDACAATGPACRLIADGDE